MPEDAMDAGPTEVRVQSHERISARERFTPGTIVGGRYRIISLIGAGGMGEVYRADDLKLDQRVALKTVPPSLSRDRRAMERLLSEVRIGRQISHPNVCRLYDIVEVDGESFIAMEFVEGEDLASLLRRIGRIPVDKALAFALEIGSGLAAAHDRGVVHRDLKPANILIDERGTARITDFGLASLTAELRGRTEIAGTPAYMAPEQLKDGEVSFRSDIYAFGLVLYEALTGRRLFDGRSEDEIRAQHAAAKARPSSVVKDLDPAIERVILRCLEENAADRPPSLHAVLAALPAGDPLQAAIAAGETPSPGMVAAAGRVGDVSAPVAWALLAGVVVTVSVVAFGLSSLSLPAQLGGVKPEAVLAERAQEIASATGAPAPRDSWSRWIGDPSYRQWRRANASRGAFASLPPGRLRFSYRQSPQPFVGHEFRISEEIPPATLPGMSSIILDHRGRLLSVKTVPPRQTAASASPAAADFSKLLEASGVDRATLRAVASERTPPVASDRRQAWSATHPDFPGVPLRIEAASLGGVPVWFALSGPWDVPGSVTEDWTVSQSIFTVVFIVAFCAGVLMARRNVLRGRADKSGAKTLFLWATAAQFVAGAATADHVPALVDEWALLTGIAGTALFSGVLVWTCYLAVEPYVRRAWPHMLISLTRLLKGRITDPMVGRDVLIGGIAGLLSGVLTLFIPQLPFFSRTLTLPVLTHASYGSPIGFLWVMGNYLQVAVLWTLGWLVLLLLFLALFRRPAVAAVALWIVLSLASVVGIDVAPELIVTAFRTAILVFVLYRYGALALAAAFFFSYSAGTFYSFSDLRSVLPLATLLAIAIYSFRSSLGGKSAWGALGLEHAAA